MAWVWSILTEMMLIIQRQRVGEEAENSPCFRLPVTLTPQTPSAVISDATNHNWLFGYHMVK